MKSGSFNTTKRWNRIFASVNLLVNVAALKTEIPMTYADMIQYIENSIDVIIQAGRHDGKRGITEFYLPGANEIGTSL